MLGYRYLTKSSAEEKLAGVLLCLKELEGKREMEGAVLTHILSTVKADFIARLVCSEEPIARNTGITFLAILPSALSPAFDPYFQALYTHEMKMKKHEISEQSTFVFDFIARSFARHDTQTSSQSMMDFVESVILTTDLSTISQPLSALTLLSQLTSSYPSASPLPQLSSEKAALLRALVMRCMVEGGGAGAFRSQTLAATHSLLTSLTPRWTVDEDGAFAVLLCSLLRNELQLILETEVQGINTSAPPSLPSSSSDRLEDITTSLTHCCHLLDSILSLIAGDDLAVEREGVWESLPSAALLSIRKSVHLIFADFASLLQEEEQQQHSLINSAYTTAVRLLTRSLCHWAACDDSLLDLLFRKLTQILR